MREGPIPGAPVEEGILPRVDVDCLTEVAALPNSKGAGTEEVIACAETLTEDAATLDEKIAEELPICTEDGARVVDIAYVVATA